LGWAFNLHLADHRRFQFAHMFGRIDSIDADIARRDGQIEALLAPFIWTTILDTKVLTAEDLCAAPAP